MKGGAVRTCNECERSSHAVHANQSRRGFVLPSPYCLSIIRFRKPPSRGFYAVLQGFMWVLACHPLSKLHLPHNLFLLLKCTISCVGATLCGRPKTVVVPYMRATTQGCPYANFRLIFVQFYSFLDLWGKCSFQKGALAQFPFVFLLFQLALQIKYN